MRNAACDAVLVDLHGVVDDEVDRLQRIDALRIAAERCERVAHRGEVDDGGNAGEVLQQHAARCGTRSPSRLRLRRSSFAIASMSARLDERVVLVAQQILEENLEAEGKLGGVAAGELVERVEAEDRVRACRRRRASRGCRRSSCLSLEFVSRFGRRMGPMRG